jgi:dihydrofolate reductase
MKLIFSAGENWELGYKNGLVFRAKRDMARFKELTLGKAVAMGRRTLESLPGGKPLKGRVNIVLTSDRSFAAEGVIAAHSTEELIELARAYGDLIIIGGESVYRQMLPHCDRAYVTRFFASAEADRFMPDFDKLEGWRKTESSEIHEENGLRFRFDTYKKTGG